MINPLSKTSADVTLFSNVSSETSEKSGFVIAGPGEYEIKDIFIKGYLIKDADVYKTTYLITFEGIKLCFASAVQAVEDIEDIDILLVPVNGDAAAAYKFAVSLEPAVIIPMDYDKKSLEQFIKESGEKAEPIDKLVVKKKDLEGKESEIIVLKEE
jgi:L-ascorbate metabolism protein UlaG (beta-lactamase superfamily)